VKRINRAVVEHPWVTILVFLTVTAVLAVPIPQLHVEADIKTMMPKDHPVFVYNEWLEDYFGVADPALVIVVNEGPAGVFTPETLALVDFISEQMAALESIDGADLVSISAINNITGSEDMLRVQPFFDEPPKTARGARAVREAVFENPMMVGTVISRDAAAAAIVAEVRPGFDDEELHRDLRAIIAKAPVTTEHLHIAGRAIVEGQILHLTRQDMGLMFPFVVAATALLLLATLRCIRGALLPLLVVLNSVIWSLGLMGWTGAVVFPLTPLMPVLIVAIGVADGIHIIHRFLLAVAARPDWQARESVFETMQEMTKPIVMTSVTTATGIGALAISPLPPVQSFAIFTSVGVLAAMVFSLTILPALLSVLPLPRHAARRAVHARSNRHSVVAVFVNTLAPLVTRYPIATMGAGILVVCLALSGVPRLVVDSSTLRNFPDSNPVKRAETVFVAHFGGTMPMQIVLDGGGVDAWKQPKKLQALADLQAFVEEQGYSSKTRSIADYVRRMNAVMNPDDPEPHVVPDEEDVIAQYLLLYSMSGKPGDLDDVVDYEYRLANVRTQITSDHSPLARRAIKDVESYAETHLAPLGIATAVSGTARTISTLGDLIVAGQVLSLGLAVVLVTLLSAWMCASAVGGLLTAIPIAVATVLNFGILGWSGEPLGIATALMSSMALGIGVDYPIHFILNYQRSRRSGLAPESAMRVTLSSSGVAIFYNVLVVLAGFLVLTTSEFPPNRVLGALVALNMLVCFLGTLTIVAAALHRFQPGFVRPGTEISSARTQTTQIGACTEQRAGLPQELRPDRASTTRSISPSAADARAAAGSHRSPRGKRRGAARE